MAMWQTGYLEFHEPTGFDHPVLLEPIRYPCKVCQAQFESVDALLKHRFEAHPFVRPVMWVRGIELGDTPMSIARVIEPADFKCVHADVAYLNGTAVPLPQLGRRLSKFRNDRVTIELANANVRAKFQLDFAIAEQADLAGVERCFRDMVRAGRLDVRAIEVFITACKAHPTASGYCDAICKYLYGMLAKERAPDCVVPYQEYRTKYEQALSGLADNERPLALIIRAIIEFHFNHFAEAAAHLPPGRLRQAAQIFETWISGKSSGTVSPLPSSRKPTAEEILAEEQVHRILSWTLVTPGASGVDLKDLYALATSDIPEFDRVKLRMLVAQHSLARGDFGHAEKIAREMRHRTGTGTWAESLLEQIERERQP